MKRIFWKKIIKFSIIGVLVALFLVIIAGLIVVNVFPCQKSADILLQLNENELKAVIEALENSQEENFYVSKFNGISKQMEDEIKKEIESLFRLGYKSVGKSGNNVYFSRWTLGKDFGAGIVYIPDGSDTWQKDYLTNLEPLSSTGWYYYEEE